jgi:hypothetical protein
MADPRRHLPPMILSEVEGCAFKLVQGSKHLHLRIDNHLVAALPRSHVRENRTWLRVRQTIRKFRNHPQQGA